MTCTSYEFSASRPGCLKNVVLLSDDTPATFPLNTAGIAGLPVGSFPLPPGSLMITVRPGKLYVLNEAGTTWTEFGSASA
jgi:hypothetical protein